MSNLTDRGAAFRAAIAGFIDARREAKLKGKEDDAEAASKYDYAGWLADAARRVGQIQAVTHVLKATHPDARGSSLHVEPSALPQHAEVGSHLLGTDYAEDVVGNAAAAHFYTFLSLQIEGRHLFDWMQAGDIDLQAALSEDADEARHWMQAFAALMRSDTQPTTHPMAKQLYWLAGDAPQDDSHYHLLQPMFPSSLVHFVHNHVHDARFSEEGKVSRQSKREGEPGNDFSEFVGTVERHLGAPPKPTNKSKHLNISHLNAERLGRNYLLSSLPPPAWKSREFANLLKLDSVFDDPHAALKRFGGIRELLNTLADFLRKNPEPVMETRQHRELIEQAIGQELATFGAAIRGSQPAGWSREDSCRLPLCERLWLDPDRTELEPRNDPEHPHWQADDLAFNAAYEHGDWADEVAGRFGRWLNDGLRKRTDKLVMLGEAEMRHFARQAILDVAWPIPLQRRAKAGAA
ncbi:MAG: type I-F CRISPR-associated protein Csy1 [Rhodanobacter sp. SCN 67-45]|nr:MAG: type I-F CRISPR-associated protein Csy1 [Rhodanobacter sp. SCN 67-45]